MKSRGKLHSYIKTPKWVWIVIGTLIAFLVAGAGLFIWGVIVTKLALIAIGVALMFGTVLATHFLTEGRDK